MGSAMCTATHQTHLAPVTAACLTNTETSLWHHSQGRLTSYLVMGSVKWASPIMERATFCPYWNSHLLWLQMHLERRVSCCRSYYPRTSGAPCPPSPQECFWSRKYLTAEQRAHALGTHCLSMFPTILKQLVQQNALLKTQLWY